MRIRATVRSSLRLAGGLLAVSLAWVALGADLPPEVQVDRLRVKAEREARDGDHWSAISTLEHALDVYETHDLEIPAAFWIRQARSLQGAGLHERAIEAAARYLTDAAREGPEYESALRVLDAAEAAVEEARRASARARAEEERRERAEAAAMAERAESIASAVPEMIFVQGDSIPSFRLSKYEVTFAQWDVCTEYGPCSWVSDEGWGRGGRPVINVSWYGAQTFAGWLSEETEDVYRLPSNEEWAHAVGAGKARYSWGNRIGHNQANCRRCGSQWDNQRTAPVGSFQANALGLHDMHGNVWEWVQNCYDAPPNVPFGGLVPGGPVPVGSQRERTDCDGRMRVGGSWASVPKSLRVNFRAWESYKSPERSYRTLGFRVALTIAP